MKLLQSGSFLMKEMLSYTKISSISRRIMIEKTFQIVELHSENSFMSTHLDFFELIFSNFRAKSFILFMLLKA